MSEAQADDGIIRYVLPELNARLDRIEGLVAQGAPSSSL